MKIGILTQYYPPEIGAPQARLSETAARLAARGHEVIVLTAMPNYPAGRIHPGYGGLFRQERRDGVTILRTWIYPAQRASFFRRLANYFSFVLSSSIVGALRLPRLDYLLTESPPLFLGISGYLLSVLTGARWIFNVSDIWPESAVRLGVVRDGSLVVRISERLETFCYRKAWLVTGQSRHIVAHAAARVPSCRTLHFTNGDDCRRFTADCRTEAARAALDGSGAACIALYAGLHGLAQGLDQVLDAAEMLRGEEGLQITLVGEGPEKRKLQAQAAERGLRNVRFLDARPAHEIPALLASADIVLVPLKTDIPGAVPSKLYEAMAVARPVVVVAHGEAAEMVRTHRTGIVVPPGHVDELAGALRLLDANPALRRSFGQNGRQLAEDRFDRDAIVARLLDSLNAGLATPAARRTLFHVRRRTRHP
jgi:colanic acid biosynthesis glycosyl transferase WcaI